MTLNDLEKEKFILREWEIIVNTISVPYWQEISTDISLNELEFKKFNSKGEIRVAISF